jgi:hypothetical protein
MLWWSGICGATWVWSEWVQTPVEDNPAAEQRLGQGIGPFLYSKSLSR